MKKNDKGMSALLDVLKAHPDLVHALIVDHARLKRLLRSKAGRELALGEDARKLLRKSVAGPGRAGKAGICVRPTKIVARTSFAGPHLQCYGGTSLSACCGATQVT
jgi:hypothetical protein